jgi:hypothetical protein
MSAHVNWETLNDYSDDCLAPAVRDEVARHLNECSECRETLAKLRSVLASAKVSALSVEPPAEAWEAIRAEIDLRKVVPLPTTARPARRIPWLRVAAIVAIIAASSATTVAIMNANKQHSVAVAIPPEVGSGVVLAIEKNYDDTVRTLRAELDVLRSKLAPETIEAVERSLKIIDDAIAEVREALTRDPASAQLRGMLSKNYQQKVDMLRRAAKRVT